MMVAGWRRGVGGGGIVKYIVNYGRMITVKPPLIYQRKQNKKYTGKWEKI